MGRPPEDRDSLIEWLRRRLIPTLRAGMEPGEDELDAQVAQLAAEGFAKIDREIEEDQRRRQRESRE